MQKIPLIPLMTESQLGNGVDRKRSFRMESFDLSVLETVEDSTVDQSFAEPIFYNLIRGKKIMQFEGQDPFDYMPGSTMIVPPNLSMEVHFPNSSIKNPTQCLSLTIDRMKIADALNLLNERYPRLDGRLWQLSMDQYTLMTNEEISHLIYKLYVLASKVTQEAKIIAELTLTELLVLLSQNQNLKELQGHESNNSLLGAILKYIQQHLEEPLTIEQLSREAAMSSTSLFRAFKREFHLSPIDYINKKRIEKAKDLLSSDPHLNISEIAYRVGFGTPNYFARVFKQLNGISPSDFKQEQEIIN